MAVLVLLVLELIISMASFQLIPLLASFPKIARRPVPALSARIPLSTNVPISAVVRSMVSPAAAADGAAWVMANLNLSISSAEELNDFAITSTTRCVSLLSRPNWRSVAPAIMAALGKSVPLAAARLSTAGVRLDISAMVKPNFASSVWASAA